MYVLEVMVIEVYLHVFMLQYCDTVIANSNQIASPSVVTARIVSDHITLVASQADGWDVKFEGGNEVMCELEN